MKALVTGVGGFVGRHLASRLLDDGWEVVGTVRPGGSPGSPGLGGVQLLAADLAHPGQATEAARAADADVAFLLAAARAESTPAQRAATLAVNCTSVQWLVDGLTDRCRTVVRLGSSTEYAQLDHPMDETAPLRPRGFFGATKAAGSLLLPAACTARGTRAVILRAFQVYGPYDHAGRLVPRALRAAGNGETLPMTGPGRRRDWVFVDDVVEACVRSALAEQLPSGQVLNIGTGTQVANEELVATVERVTGHPVRMAAGAHPGCPWDAPSWVCDPALARQLLGWEAKVDLAQGIRRTWQAELAG